MKLFPHAILIAMLFASGCDRSEQKQTTKEQLAITPPAAVQNAAEVDPSQAASEALAEAKENIAVSVEDIQLKIDIDPVLNAPPVAPSIEIEQELKADGIIVEQPKPSAPLPKIPDRARELMPEVNKAIDDIWPDMPMRSYFPAQIEQESCISLKHSKCWNPRAELKTAREYGFGLGQITIAYKADGSERFNVFKEVKTMHPDLRNWAWEDRYNPLLQIKAIVVKNRVNWGSIKWETADLDNKMAFLAAYYNGGSPLKDRNLCVNTKGCDPTRWWGNVERYSTKSKTPLKEYGNRSIFQISREYPVNVLRVRRPKYVPYTGT